MRAYYVRNMYSKMYQNMHLDMTALYVYHMCENMYGNMSFTSCAYMRQYEDTICTEYERQNASKYAIVYDSPVCPSYVC